jgi:hypothetical protein
MTPSPKARNKLDFDPHTFLVTIGEGRRPLLAGDRPLHAARETGPASSNVRARVAIFTEASDRALPTANQVDDQNHQRYYQQQVNQAAGDVQAEPQEPQNQKNNENRPKHINLLFILSLASLLSS